jgi:hypothetical protein
MTIGDEPVPPVSSPTRAGQDSDRVFRVAEVNVIGYGLVGYTPA